MNKSTKTNQPKETKMNQPTNNGQPPAATASEPRMTKEQKEEAKRHVKFLGSCTREVQQKDLVFDKAFNVRQVYTEIDELAANIDRNGLREAVVGWDIGGGKYKIMSGHRRDLAIGMIAKKREVPEAEMWVPLTIVDAPADEKLAKLYNIAYNGEREEVVAHDLAKRFSELEKDGVSRNDIKKITGYSVSNIGNLIRAWTKLEPSILSHWTDDTNPVKLPLQRVFKWASLDSHEEQLAAYKEWKGEGNPTDEGERQRDAAGSGEGEGDSADADEKKAPTKKEIHEKLEAYAKLDKDGKLSEEKAHYRKALRWVLGAIKQL